MPKRYIWGYILVLLFGIGLGSICSPILNLKAEGVDNLSDEEVLQIEDEARARKLRTELDQAAFNDYWARNERLQLKSTPYMIWSAGVAYERHRIKKLIDTDK